MSGPIASHQFPRAPGSGGGGGGPIGGRPSDERRAALRKADDYGGGAMVPVLSNFCPIDRYFSAADKVLEAFEETFNEGNLDDAYIFGRRFATFSTKALPSHDYYKSGRDDIVALRTKNQKDSTRVVMMLEKVADLMDEEEGVKARKLAEEQRKVDEEQRRRKEFLKKRGKSSGHWDSKSSVVEDSSSSDLEGAMKKLDMLHNMLPKTPQGVGPTQQNAHLPNFHPSGFDHQEGESKGDLPLPVPPPPKGAAAADETLGLPPPPSYNQLLSTKKLSSLSSIQSGGPPSYAHIMANKFSPNSSLSNNSISASSTGNPNILPIKTLTQMYTSDYEAMKTLKKIEVFRLNTFQGRIKVSGRDSTNGCTVISPLVASHHLRGPSGISDTTIEHIIDNEAPPILRAVRSKLGLGNDALIIPSDVHDYLVDQNILHQENFVGVSGGNILDSDHIKVFLDMLEKGDETRKDVDYTGKKLAAALFFHEHVVSIVKVVLSTGVAWYDIVDSMPVARGRAARRRCKDRESLEVALRYYACSKFSPSNCSYIDRNEWDDAMCDFDPRVFQAFVWAQG